MFAPLVGEVTRRDCALPGLATVLDPAAFVARLREAIPTVQLEAAHITYVKYQPGSFCRVGYQLQVGQSWLPLYASVYGPTAPQELTAARVRKTVPGLLGRGQIILEDCAAVVTIFPNDRKIKVLSSLGDQEARVQLFRALLPNRPELWNQCPCCLTHKPERRYVARVQGRGETGAVVKVFSRKWYAQALANSNAFAARGPLRLARRLDTGDYPGFLAFDWVPGRTLGETLTVGPLDWDSLQAVGAALAELHSQQPPFSDVVTPASVAAAVYAVAETLAWLRPDLAARVKAMAKRLGALLTGPSPGNVALHGDFNPTQVVLSHAGVVFLDLDRTIRGESALDLGTFAARLEREVLRGHIPQDRAEIVERGLLQSYEGHERLRSAGRVNLYAAAGLLRWLDPLRYWEPRRPTSDEVSCWPPYCPGKAELVLDRVESLLDAAW